jgi:hypothetical protein
VLTLERLVIQDSQTYAAARAEARISSSFLMAASSNGLSKEEFAVLFVVGPGRVPLALAGVL